MNSGANPSALVVCFVKCWFSTRESFKHPWFWMLTPSIPFSFLSSFFFLACSFLAFLFALIWGDFSFVSAGWFSFSSSRSLWWISAATWLCKSSISVKAMSMKHDNHLDLVLTWLYWNLIPPQMTMPCIFFTEHTLWNFTEIETWLCPKMQLPCGRQCGGGCFFEPCLREGTLCFLRATSELWQIRGYTNIPFFKISDLMDFTAPVLPSSCHLLTSDLRHSPVSVFFGLFFFFFITDSLWSS